MGHRPTLHPAVVWSPRAPSYDWVSYLLKSTPVWILDSPTLVVCDSLVRANNTWRNMVKIMNWPTAYQMEMKNLYHKNRQRKLLWLYELFHHCSEIFYIFRSTIYWHRNLLTASIMTITFRRQSLLIYLHLTEFLFLQLSKQFDFHNYLLVIKDFDQNSIK